MTPALRLAFSLVLSLLLWLPTVPGALTANEDPARIAIRYLLALIVSRIGVGLVFRIVNGYAAQVEAVEEESPDAVEEPSEAEMLFGRRREDAGDPVADELLDEVLEDAHATTSLVP